jgi:hypothetical protein
MHREVPKEFIQHLDPEEVELGGVGFVGRHEVGVDADGEDRFDGDIEHSQVLYVL